MSALLEVEDLRVRFRVAGLLGSALRGGPTHIEAVAGVSFALDEGRTLALVGESGSGKTTIARAIIGLLPVQSGRIRFAGQDITGRGDAAMRPVRRDMAMMWQDPVGSLSPRLTVRSLLSEPFRVHGLTDRDLAAEARRLLDLVGLPAAFAERYPHQLSGGQARRVGVARAVALQPRLVIADEPTAGLDVSIQGEVLNLLNDLQDRLGLAILIITHNLAVVRHVAHRTAVMYLGRIVEQAPTAALFAAPRHPYAEALLAASPEPDPDARHRRIELAGEVPSLLQRPPGCEFHPRCPRAQPRCRGEAPAFTVHGDRGWSCHFPVGEAAAATGL
ncbi:MAG: ABC transporter ATP-binding protein [Dongiaceae bacterium]